MRRGIAETRRKFDQDFQQGAVRLVVETGKPSAQVARELGVNAGTLGELGCQGPPGEGSGQRRAV